MKQVHIFTYLGIDLLNSDSLLPKKIGAFTENDFLAKEFLNMLVDGKALCQLSFPKESFVTYNFKDKQDVLNTIPELMLPNNKLKWYQSKAEQSVRVLTTDYVVDNIIDGISNKTSMNRHYNDDFLLVALSFLKNRSTALSCVRVIEILKDYGLRDYFSLRIWKYVDPVSYYLHFTSQWR